MVDKQHTIKKAKLKSEYFKLNIYKQIKNKIAVIIFTSCKSKLNNLPKTGNRILCGCKKPSVFGSEFDNICKSKPNETDEVVIPLLIKTENKKIITPVKHERIKDFLIFNTH